MASFSITITDTKQLAGLKASREAHNKELSVEYITDDKGNNVLDKDGKAQEKPVAKRANYCATDQDYIQFVMTRACESYANQFKV